MVGCIVQYFVVKYICHFGKKCRDVHLLECSAGRLVTEVGVAQWQNPTNMSPKQKVKTPLRDPPSLTHQLLPLGSIISNTKALTVPCVRPKMTPKHRRSPKAPYFAALMYYNTISINATTKPVVRKRWSPRKNVYHGSPAGSFSSKEAKEAAIRAATVSSPLTYRFGELCNSLWVPLAELCELAHLTCMPYPIFFPPSTLPCAEQTFSLTAWLMDIQKASLWAL